MSVNYPDLFGRQYATAVELLLQQRGSRLRMAVTEGSYKGDQASPVDQIGSVAMQQVTSRFGAINRVDSALSRRWVLPSDWDLAQLVDSYDELKTLSDPKSKYVMNAMFAAGRKIDELIIDAFFDDAVTGTNGGSTTTASADNVGSVAVNFGASSNTNLTVAKLRDARRQLMAAEVDLDFDRLYCVVTASQHDSLLGEAQVVSTDFNEKPVLKEGRIERFMGFDFIHTELLNVDGNSYRRVPCFAKSGMHLGVWANTQTKVSERDDLSGIPWQAYLKMSMGATRIEGEKIVEIKCAES